MISETLLTVCVVLAASEIVCRLITNNSALKFLRGLIVILMLCSMLLSFRDINMEDWGYDKELITENDELSEYLNGSYQDSVQKESSAYITGLLKTVEIIPKNIEVFTDNADDGSIRIDKIQIAVKNDSDKARAAVLLGNIKEEGTDVEVYVD